MEITSVHNPKVKEWCRLHQKKHREQTGMFLIEGMHLIEEAQRAGLPQRVQKRPVGAVGKRGVGKARFQREGVVDVVCVVTRYFGGVLLGAGGLVRAYTQSAKDALDAAGISVVRQWSQITLRFPYHLLERIRQEAEEAGGVLGETEYAADVGLTLLLPEGSEAGFADRVVELTAGAVRPAVTGKAFRAVPVSERTGKNGSCGRVN